MAYTDRDTTTSYTTRPSTGPAYTRDTSRSTAWIIGIVVALALLAIVYLVYSASSQPATTTVDVNSSPAVTTPMAPADTLPATEATPMVEAPAMTTAPATDTMAPADTTAPATTAPAAPATDTTAPAATPAPVQ